jgi:hypothetical protein
LLFFLLSTRFATLLTFFRSFSPAFLIKRGLSGPGRAFLRTSTRRPPLSSNALVLLLDPRKNHPHSSERSPRLTEILAAVHKQARARCPRLSEEEVDYSSSPSRRRHRQATDDGTGAALHSQGHNRARRCTGNTEELSTLWPISDDGEKDNLFRFSTRTMEHSLLVGFHGNRFVCCSPWQPLLRAWRQPSMVRLSIVRHRIWGLGYCRGALTSLTMSGKLMMLADEWRTNGCIKPCCEEIKKAQQPSSTLQSTGHIGVLRTMENFDNLPWNFSLQWPA